MGQNKNVKTKEERTPKKKKTRYGKRIAFLETALLLAFIIVIIDIFCIMVVLGPERLEVAVQQWTRTSTITANRGQIVDCNGKVLATTGAVYKILLWPKNITSGSEERVARELSDKEKKTVAYHEVGHALVAALQSHSAPVQKITIVPRTMGALGYTLQTPEEEKYLETKDELIAKITTFMAGRAAEVVVFHSATSGAANDMI